MLVVPSLGPDKLLLDNSIMGAFGAVLDWQTEELTFKSSPIKIPAVHRKMRLPHDNSTDATCSIVALSADDAAVPVYTTRKCSVPPQHEMAIEIYTLEAPEHTTAALVEPRIIIDRFRRIIVARTVCHWEASEGDRTISIWWINSRK